MNYQQLQNRNIGQSESPSDLTNLPYLNEPSVLHALHNRYNNKQIYTYSGIVLVSINPYQNLPEFYNDNLIKHFHKDPEAAKVPHLYSIASSCYHALTTDSKNQTIIVSGESGAGKTVAAKYIMRYLTSVQGVDHNGVVKRSVENQVLATNPIMEAFGNAKTIRNDNSSRFGKYVTISFDENLLITGANVNTYLLERSRVVSLLKGERNYHIFYQLITGCTEEQRDKWFLESASSFNYLSQGNCDEISGVDDSNDFTITCRALSTIGISESRQEDVFCLLAALLHLGNIEVCATRNEAQIQPGDGYLQKAALLLGVDSSTLAKWIVKRQLKTRSETIITSSTLEHAISIRDSVAKYLYSALFLWIVHMINASLDHNKVKRAAYKYIGVVDIYGFEHFEKNSMEQFCINYANEKLQQEFNKHVFKLEQEEYVKEGLDWRLIEYSDNQGCISLIEDKLGILSLLDEECRLPSGNHQSFLQKLNNQLPTKHSQFYKKSRFNDGSFMVKHYALDVSYQVHDFLAKNSDAIPDEFISLLQNSKNEFITYLLDFYMQLVSSQNKNPRKTAISRKPTLSSMFKSSLSQLMTTVSSTNVHYIRCIKPNEEKLPWTFSPPMVLSQLRACGVFETIRISSLGFPARFSYEEFAHRFRILLSSKEWEEDNKKLTLNIVNSVIPHDNLNFQVGRSKIFFRSNVIGNFEEAHRATCSKSTVLLQSAIRGFFTRKEYQRTVKFIIKLQSVIMGWLTRQRFEREKIERAAILIQAHWRSYIQRKRYLSLIKCAIVIQSIVRKNIAYSRYINELRESSATLLAKFWRAYNARKTFRGLKKSVIALQCVSRSVLTRRYLRRLQDSAGRTSILYEKQKNLQASITEVSKQLKSNSKKVTVLRNKLNILNNSLSKWKCLIKKPSDFSEPVSMDFTSNDEQLVQLLQAESKLRQASQQLYMAAKKSELGFVQSQTARENLSNYYQALQMTVSEKFEYDTEQLPSRVLFYAMDRYFSIHKKLKQLLELVGVENASLLPNEVVNKQTKDLLYEKRVVFLKQIKQALTVSSLFNAVGYKDGVMRLLETDQNSLLFAGVVNFLIFAGISLDLKTQISEFLSQLCSYFTKIVDGTVIENDKTLDFYEKPLQAVLYWFATLHKIRSFLVHLLSINSHGKQSVVEDLWNPLILKFSKHFSNLENSFHSLVQKLLSCCTEGSINALLNSKCLPEFIDAADENTTPTGMNIYELIDRMNLIHKLLISSALQPNLLELTISHMLQHIGQRAFQTLIHG